MSTPLNFYQQVIDHPDWTAGPYMYVVKSLIPARLQAEYEQREIALFNEMFTRCSAEERASLLKSFPPVTKESQAEARTLAETCKHKLAEEEAALRELRRTGCSDARTLRRAHEDIGTYGKLYDKYVRLAEIGPPS